MTTAVLDASALLAMLLVESGEDQVRAVLSDCVISTVNLSEVIGHFARHGADHTHIRGMLDQLALQRIAFDEDLAYATGLLTTTTRAAGLSLGDRACLALARRLNARAITADHAWAGLGKSAGVDVHLIR
jgi:ribonuclease VapC